MRPDLASWLRRMDLPLFLACLFLSLLSLPLVASAGASSTLVLKQALALAVGLWLAVCLFLFNYRVFRTYAAAVLAVCLFFLLLVILIGPPVRGSRAWLFFGPFSLQPSEMARLGLVWILAAMFSDAASSRPAAGSLVRALGVAALFVGLIWLEPDFSSSVIFLPVCLAMLYLARAPAEPLFLAILAAAGLVFSLAAHVWMELQGRTVSTAADAAAAAGLWLAAEAAGRLRAWIRTGSAVRIFRRAGLALALGFLAAAPVRHLLADYQKQRIAAFLSPVSDPTGAAYNTVQSIVAIGSGGLFGKGLFQGTQTRLGFVPAQHTDFIYSVLCEELGGLAGLFVVAVYGWISLRCFRIGRGSPDEFGRLLACGLGFLIGIAAFLNLAMATGLLPVLGVPLPFLSYGGTSMVTNWACIGLLLSIHARRHMLVGVRQ